MSAPKEEEKDKKQVIFIIRRVKKVVHGHHGGSWKIAYADFVTAMMTFFMLMWLLSMLNKAQLEGISEYFKNPNRKSSQQAVETKIKTENALSSKMATGMNTNSEQNKETKTEKKKEEQKMQVNMEAGKNSKVSDAKESQNKQMSLSVDAKMMQKKLEAMKADIEKQLQNNPHLSQYKNSLNVKVTSEGLKIELKELQGKPMFSNGKADFANYAKDILNWLAPTLNKYPNRVMIIGHTDSRPVKRADYSNWELSSDRAAATRQTLVDSGMDDRKIVRIVGVADTNKIKEADPSDDINRRIVIMVLSDHAYQQMQDE